ncbi:CheR family methyltransferase [Rhizobium oryzicola]|uniref:Chemotaxis protein methyltransferase n=1 Tax=Rhizobium oryzicola TaxID=1232668 RepID=A0ABT8SR35_9HYPH|nr:protein-glutamate O-methyltransferase CheR [Rhizobium oryzicola]MDO1580503.1 protein-glutamate O-methyltransferase CheR [Rhizobium oryzicola]
MSSSNAASLTAQPLDDRLSKRSFEKLSKYIYNYSGIKMPHSKVTMLEGRLRRRLRVTGIATFDAYVDYLFEHDGLKTESIYLIDAVTTNKTDFFREPKHFEFLTEKALPDMLSRKDRTLRIWSSACSIGAEPYTIAMVLDEAIGSRSDVEYRILATDLSTDVLRAARRGIYPNDMISPVPKHLQRKYVMQAIDPQRGEARIVPQLRQKVGFARLNLMDDAYPIRDQQHMIFCRNVLIYFDKPTQQHVLTRLCDNLVPGGYLFIGHSETTGGLDLPIKQVANTIFKRI